MLAMNVTIELSSRIPTDGKEEKEEATQCHMGEERPQHPAAWACIADAAHRGSWGPGRGLCASLENIHAVMESEGVTRAVSPEAWLPHPEKKPQLLEGRQLGPRKVGNQHLIGSN